MPSSDLSPVELAPNCICSTSAGAVTAPVPDEWDAWDKISDARNLFGAGDNISVSAATADTAEKENSTVLKTSVKPNAHAGSDTSLGKNGHFGALGPDSSGVNRASNVPGTVEADSSSLGASADASNKQADSSAALAASKGETFSGSNGPSQGPNFNEQAPGVGRGQYLPDSSLGSGDTGNMEANRGVATADGDNSFAARNGNPSLFEIINQRYYSLTPRVAP